MLKTENEGWGFYGTMGGNAETAWDYAMSKLINITGKSEESVREFLDSTMGRHFADAVNDYLLGLELTSAIDAAIEEMMRWRNKFF